MIGHHIHGRGAIRAVVLHGWFGDGGVFAPVLPALDPDVFTIAIPDYRGYGASRHLAGPFDVATIASDVARLTRHLGWADYAVIGHSMGAKAALRLALDEGDRVRRLLALTPVWAGPGLDAETLRFFRQAANDPAVRAAILRVSTGGRAPEAWSHAFARQSQEASTPQAFAAYLESWACGDFAEAASALSHEVLVVAGEHDGGIPPQVVQATWMANLRNARLVVLAGSGHYPMVETPLALGALIDGFLRGDAPA
jgi:pimeloyl-ACP methyl ester carboxylesterase